MFVGGVTLFDIIVVYTGCKLLTGDEVCCLRLSCSSAAVDGARADGISARRRDWNVDRNAERRRLQLRRDRARNSLPRRAVPLLRGPGDDAGQEYVDRSINQPRTFRVVLVQPMKSLQDPIRVGEYSESHR